MVEYIPMTWELQVQFPGGTHFFLQMMERLSDGQPKVRISDKVFFRDERGMGGVGAQRYILLFKRLVLRAYVRIVWIKATSIST